MSGVRGHREAQGALDMPHAPSIRVRRGYPSTADGSYPPPHRISVKLEPDSPLLGYFAAHRVRVFFSDATPTPEGESTSLDGDDASHARSRQKVK